MFRLLKVIKAIGQRTGDFLARLILTFFYFVLLGPFALWMRPRRTLSGKTVPVSGSFWERRQTSSPTLDNARRGY